MARCEGLTGEALEKCRRQSLMEGTATSRWIGLFAIVFGLLILWQPIYFVWLVAGFLILISIFLLIARKFFLALIFFIGGAILFLYPAILMYLIAILFIVAGLIVVATALRYGMPSDATSALPALMGFILVIVGVIFFFYPDFATTIVGLVMLFAGFLLLITGYEGVEEGWTATSEWVRK